MERLTSSKPTRILEAVRELSRTAAPIVLAVSGGVDSMVLLDAAASMIPRERLRVATLDHGTGEFARHAARLVHDRARLLRIPCDVGRARTRLSTEAEWRAARWSFLRAVARRVNGVVATAHTRDDQVETIVMRVLRGAGARGLAGLYARSDVQRPLIDCTREEILAYAGERGIEWADDPSNALPIHFRNRVRHDILPAMRRVNPAIDSELLDIARRAAALRAAVEDTVVDRARPSVREGGRALDVDAGSFADASLDALRMLWPPLAASIGITLDRRGMERLAEFTQHGRVGGRVQLAGGWEVVRARSAFRLRRSTTPSASHATTADIALSNETRWREWIFRPATSEAARGNWVTWLPTDEVLQVRAWQPGDAMVHGAARRKVKRLLSGAGITGHERTGWPVVMSGSKIVWIPGVRRSDAASDRSGRPGLSFTCEHIDR